MMRKKTQGKLKKDSAESAAKFLQGVKGVNNQTQGKPTVSTTQVEAEIEEALQSILFYRYNQHRPICSEQHLSRNIINSK